MKAWIVVKAWVVAGVVVCGWLSCRAATAPVREAAPRLMAGDLVQVTVVQTPELATVARLDSEGRLNMPAAGLVPLAGLTQHQAEQVLDQRLRQTYLLHPQVQLLVKEYADAPVTVLGAVRHPGVYSVRWRRDLLSVVAQAGGWLQESGDTILVTRRDGNGAEQTLRWNLDDVERAGAPGNPLLEPGDVVRVVPAASVYIGGEVHKPGQYAMPTSGLTLLEALTLAGGARTEGVRARTRIVHSDEIGHRSVQVVDAGRIMQGRAADLPLRPYDLVYVPSSASRTTLVRGMETAVAAGVTILTGVIIFH